MTESNFIDLYSSNSVDVWCELEPENEIITLSLMGRITISMSKEEFQDLYNAVFASKTVLKELEDKK